MVKELGKTRDWAIIYNVALSALNLKMFEICKIIRTKVNFDVAKITVLEEY